MTFRHTLHLHDEYIDHELSAQDRAAVEAHVAVCPACRDDLHRLGTLKSTLGRTPVPDPGSEYFDHLEETILARSGSAVDPEQTPVTVVDLLAGRGRLLKMLIRLAAAVTLLFAAFYVSDMSQTQPGTGGLDRFASQEVTDPSRLPEPMLQPQAGINMVGIPAPVDEQKSAPAQDDPDSGNGGK